MTRGGMWSTRVVDRFAPINSRQVEVLQWIADGCPDGVMTGFTHKTTAKALQGRGLAEVGVRGGAWRAEVTDAGRHYLIHGGYPPRMRREKQATRGATPATGQRAGRPAAHASARAPATGTPPERAAPPVRLSVGELAESLIARVVGAGGRICAGDILEGAVGEHVIMASRHAPNLPFGKRLRLLDQSWPRSAREVYLDEDFAVRVAERPVPVPQRVTRLHPAAAAYRDDADRQEVSRDLATRAVRIIHALAAEAERRGHQVTTPRPATGQYNSAFISSLKDGQLVIGIDGFSYPLRIREQQGPGKGTRAYSNSESGRNLPRWRTARATTFTPTGRLQITAGHGYGRHGRPAEFRDTKTRALEGRLPAVLRELEIRALEDDWRRQEEERKAAERRQRWEQAMDRARDDFRQAALAVELASQLERFRLVGEIDQYLAALHCAPQPARAEQRASARDWIDWITTYRDQINPARHPPVMPATPDPSPDDLRPFLKGLSPHDPDSHRLRRGTPWRPMRPHSTSRQAGG